jgi:hypothetical protein
MPSARQPRAPVTHTRGGAQTAGHTCSAPASALLVSVVACAPLHVGRRCQGSPRRSELYWHTVSLAPHSRTRCALRLLQTIEPQADGSVCAFMGVYGSGQKVHCRQRKYCADDRAASRRQHLRVHWRVRWPRGRRDLRLALQKPVCVCERRVGQWQRGGGPAEQSVPGRRRRSAVARCAHTVPIMHQLVLLRIAALRTRTLCCHQVRMWPRAASLAWRSCCWLSCCCAS